MLTGQTSTGNPSLASTTSDLVRHTKNRNLEKNLRKIVRANSDIQDHLKMRNNW